MVKLSEVASADASKRPIIAETEHLIIQDALKEEIPDIIAMENDPENSDFIWQGTPEQHADEIDDPAHMLVMIRDKSDYHVVGYSLIHINKQSEIFELRRIAMNEKGKGYGTEILAAYFKLAFESLGINRFWLDVYPDNVKGIHLYEKMGMHRDGVLRQNYKAARGYLDQIIYSMLKSEYFAGK